MARKELRSIWEQACNLKGRPDYLKMPVQIGRKFNVTITRSARNANKATYKAEPYVFNGSDNLIFKEDDYES